MRVCWLSYFPVEWLPEVPEPLRGLPRLHPATWQRVLVQELKGRADLKLHVIAVRKQFPRHVSFESEGVTFHCLKVPPGMRTLSLFWWETRLIRRCLRVIQPDVVHAWGTERGAALVAQRCGYPYLVTMQGLLNWCLESVELGMAVRLEAMLERVSLRRAKVVTAESKFAVGWLERHYPHLEVRQVEHAPNWLFHKLDRQPETKPLSFLYVGSLSELKGTDILLRGLDKLRQEMDFRLMLVGSGAPEFVSGLKRSTSSALWERITVRDGLTQAEVAQEMSRATMVLFPTRVDNSPNSVKESVVAGVPVVGSAVGGLLDYVVPGRNGLRFAPGNLEEFISAIRSAAAHPFFSNGRVNEDTLRQMREYLSPRVMGEKFLGAYERVRERRGEF